MGDNNQTTDVEDPSVEQIDKSYNVPVVCRTQEWFKDTSQKLVILVRKVTQLVSHEHWKVRSAVVNWSTKLLMECKESLKECLSPLLEVLLMVANDDFKEVSSRSIEVLKNFQACYLTTGDQSVLDVLEENFHLLTTKLPRVLRTSDDVGKLQTLKLLCGYLLLFGPSVCHLLQSLPHLERLMISLLQLAELDCSDVRMLEETALPVESCGTETALPRWPKKSFKYFFDTQIEECLVQICRLLGYYGDPSLLIDYLLDKLHESSVYCKQAILIINQILLGWKGIEVSKKDIFCERSADQKEAEIEDLVKCIIEEYTCETLWEVPLSNSQETTVSLMLHHSPERASLTVERLNSNILQCCLLLEGVTACSEVLGQNFRPFLITVLCPVMEKAGSNCGLVSHTAHVALHFMSFHCHYSSVADIIEQNADYLVNILSLKLRHFTENPGIPVVLKVVLQKCDCSILLLVQDMVSEVLCALDYFHNVQSLPLVRVMLEVMNAIQRWFPAQPEDISSRSPVLPPSQRVKKFLLDYLHNKQLAETFSDEDDESIENPDGRSTEINGYFNDDEKKPEKPLHVRMVLDILQRCVHLQASNNIWVHLLVLDMISVGVVVLKQHQDDLLPMVHQLWKPFVQQFSNDVTVMIKAFETLSAMVSTCGDFIRQRTLQDVWPKLMRFLENQAKTSYGKNSGSYQFTGNYKFQLKILSGVGLLAQKLGFQENEVGLLASTLHPYLSCSQPVTLQQAALGAFDTLIELDPDVVWLYLISLSSSVNLQPPHPSLCPVELRCTNDEPECTSNVQYLLQKLGG
ncbi:TELO2-interacting protein 1 homolog [Tachypleus tridentatus]|uniref:TELO2-interacting protein 1 homolog n=1 Tax=Tachypleus tridentatus TaxID=6853 RepID=UPI003FD54469